MTTDQIVEVLESWRTMPLPPGSGVRRAYRFEAGAESTAAVVEHRPDGNGCTRAVNGVYVFAVADPDGARARARNNRCRYLYVALGAPPLEMLELALLRWYELYGAGRQQKETA